MNVDNPYLPPTIELETSRRATFITRTYTHLFLAILSFVGIELSIFQSGFAETLASKMLSVNWLFVLGGFMIASWLARSVAHRAKSLPTQYLGLGLFVLAQAIIFVPLLYVADHYAPGAIKSAAMVTIAGTAGLTLIVFYTRKDFSFLRSILAFGGVLALIAIVAGAIFGFQLGTWFSVGMIALAGGGILHDTSKIMHHYHEDQYVGAALELFASVALLFWYVLRLFMSRD